MKDQAQGRILDCKKEGAQEVRGLTPKIYWANLRDFLKNLKKKGWACAPPPPLDPRLRPRVQKAMSVKEFSHE